MEQDLTNPEVKSNRFIFSDDFYNNLDDSSEEPKKDFEPIEPLDNVLKEENTSFIGPEIETNNVEIEEPVIPEFNFTDINNDVEIRTKDETVIPEFNFNNEQEEVKDAIPDFSYIETTNLEAPSVNSVADTEYKRDSLNVETGIDTTLEQEILKSKGDIQPKIPIVENNLWNTSQERVAYRAQRNANPIPSVWEEEEKEIPTATIVETIPSNDYIQPPIINIDEELLKEPLERSPIFNGAKVVDYEENNNTFMVQKSDLLFAQQKKEKETGKISILARYGDDFCSRDYITNPAIGRKEEIKKLILTLLTPEKSAILVGKPGIGKTSIVEGLAYQLQRNNVPDALKGYCIVSVKTTSLLGSLPNGETRLQSLIDELKGLSRIILFIDEIHMLMGNNAGNNIDFANMFKESLGRGSIKMIGATTNDEYEQYVLRDKAFVRRFQRIDVEEPTREQTIKILMGTLPKIEATIGAKLKYSEYIKSEIMAFIVDITTEYKRIYGIGSRYPDICLTLLSQAFSQAVFDNRQEVNILDVRNAIANSTNIYQDVISKELVNFDIKFKQLIDEDK